MRLCSTNSTALAVFGATILLLALGDMGCGSDAADSKFGDGSPDGAAPPGFGDNDAGGADGSVFGDAGGLVETCGGKPCANHQGPKDFLEPDVSANAGVHTFVAGTPNPNGTNGAQEPTIVHPVDRRCSRSTSRTFITNGARRTNDSFRIVSTVRRPRSPVYTKNASWEPTDEEWDWIAELNRGSAVTVTVAGLNQAAPQQVWQSKPITVFFSAAEVEGALYYWSTGSAGIMKALVSDRIPQKFYTDPTAPDKGTCVACHTLSRDGKRLAVNYGGEKLKEVSGPRTRRRCPGHRCTHAGGWLVDLLSRWQVAAARFQGRPDPARLGHGRHRWCRQRHCSPGRKVRDASRSSGRRSATKSSSRS